MLINHVILSVSRLTDEKRSGSRKKPQENLTLVRLLDLRETKYDKLRSDLQKRWTTIKADAAPMRQYRHKLLAHASMADYLSQSTKLGDGITLGSMRAILDKIGDYLSTFECFFTGVDAAFYYPRGAGEAADLLAYLRLAVDAETKQTKIGFKQRWP